MISLPRAPSKCLEKGCRKAATKKGRCEACYQPWAHQSPRNRDRPSNAATLVRRVRRRDRDRCYLCGSHGQIVDHIRSVAEGGSWDLSNLACICGPCHHEKTQGEAARGRARRT
ncbi:HNH endonuclease signature motif containing protein [Nonomuraea sp. NPDC049129]|uniref:HNH endonuclease n=1 Tax=Nonomuraea sp. NPDC049129 TaxID=3155272 RepID=UPI0033D1A9A3